MLDARMLQSWMLVRHYMCVYYTSIPCYIQVFASYQDDHPLDEEELLGSKITVSISIAGGNTQVGVGPVVSHLRDVPLFRGQVLLNLSYNQTQASV